uniref:Peptidase M48 domain-containing protein n=1 Tax=candidate division WOR-3 bacterium TaxID=2052148 RepID=A0A7C6ECT3_UNCW3
MKQRITFYEQKKRNKRIVIILWLILVGVFALLGGTILAFLGSRSEETPFLPPVLLGMLGGGLFGLVYMIGAYYLASQLLLKRLNAREINPSDINEVMFKNVAEEMAIAAGIPPPAVYIIDDAKLINALASGRSKTDSSICITTGLLNLLNRDELQGVIGHEIAHIKSEDTKAKFTYLAVVGFLAMVAKIAWLMFLVGLNYRPKTEKERKKEWMVKGGAAISLLVAIVFKIASFFAKLLSLAIGRRQEYLADAGSVEFTRNPTALANALRKIRDGHCPHPKISFAEAPFFISDPRPKNIRKLRFFERFLSTHPPIEERIKRLESMGAEINDPE